MRSFLQYAERKIEGWGFNRDPTESSVFERDCEYFLQSIEERSSDWPDGIDKGMVVVGLVLKDSFNDKPETWPLCMRGDLFPDKVVNAELNSHPWRLAPDDFPSALDALERYGVPWVEHWSDVRNIIRYYETALSYGVRLADEGYRQAPMHLRTRSLFSRVKPRKPPGFHYYLSVLYFKLNDIPSALEHAQAYRKIHREEHDIAEWDRRIQLITRRGSA